MASSIVSLVLPLTHPGYLIRFAVPDISQSKGIHGVTTRVITDLFWQLGPIFNIIKDSLLCCN